MRPLAVKTLIFLICSNNWKLKGEIKSRGDKWLEMNHIKAFYAVTSNKKMAEGAQAAIDFCGLGKLSPNMVLLGFHVSITVDDRFSDDLFSDNNGFSDQNSDD